MSWLFWLGLAAIVVAIAAVTGFKPRHTRHVAHTQLMGVGRIVLGFLALGAMAAAYVAWRGR